jgi:hypothetical protein
MQIEELKFNLQVVEEIQRNINSEVQRLQKELAEAIAATDGIRVRDRGHLCTVESFNWSLGKISYHGARIKKSGEWRLIP